MKRSPSGTARGFLVGGAATLVYGASFVAIQLGCLSNLMQAPVVVLLVATTVLGLSLLAAHAAPRTGWRILAPGAAGLIVGLYLQPSSGLLLGIVVLAGVLIAERRPLGAFLRALVFVAIGTALGYWLQLSLSRWSGMTPGVC